MSDEQSIEARVALARGWKQHTNARWAPPWAPLAAFAVPPPVTPADAFEMLEEMMVGLLILEVWKIPDFYHVDWDGREFEADTLEHAIAECWLAWREANEVRE